MSRLGMTRQLDLRNPTPLHRIHCIGRNDAEHTRLPAISISQYAGGRHTTWRTNGARPRMTTAVTKPAIEVRPSGDPVGAAIHGVDLARPMSDATFRLVEDALHAHGMLCFRGQTLHEAQFMDFVLRFGPVQRLFLDRYAMADWPDILLVSNIQENGRNIGHADAGRVWHTDMSYMEVPARATVLHALEVPTKEDGTVLGDTLFANAANAYDALEDAVKQQLEGLRVVHRISGRRKTVKDELKDDDARRREMPDVVHPFVRDHPHTGRKCLYVSDGECIGIEGMAEEDALPLIREMAERIVMPENRHRHKWQAGDVVIWDNCLVQHLAIHDYELPLRRLIWRSTVKGVATG